MITTRYARAGSTPAAANPGPSTQAKIRPASPLAGAVYKLLPLQAPSEWKRFPAQLPPATDSHDQAGVRFRSEGEPRGARNAHHFPTGASTSLS